MIVPPKGAKVRAPDQLWDVTDIDVDTDGTIWVAIEPVMGLVWVKPEEVELTGDVVV